MGHIPEDNDPLLIPDEKLVGVGGTELDGADLPRLGLGGRLDAGRRKREREERRVKNELCQHLHEGMTAKQQ